MELIESMTSPKNSPYPTRYAIPHDDISVSLSLHNTIYIYIYIYIIYVCISYGYGYIHLDRCVYIYRERERVLPIYSYIYIAFVLVVGHLGGVFGVSSNYVDGDFAKHVDMDPYWSYEWVP